MEILFVLIAIRLSGRVVKAQEGWSFFHLASSVLAVSCSEAGEAKDALGYLSWCLGNGLPEVYVTVEA